MASLPLSASLLRPAIIHILRASGFHSSRTVALDTLTDLAARHLLLLAAKTADQVIARIAAARFDENAGHGGEAVRLDDLLLNLFDGPSISDVRLALKSACAFSSSTTPTEELWNESLRKPLSSYPHGARLKERHRRDMEDTRDVREFTDWASGPINREVHRIAGMLKDPNETNVASSSAALPDAQSASREKTSANDDYLVMLKKKYSKTGDGARFAGTVLGRSGEERGTLRIDGGPATLESWGTNMKKRKRTDTTATEQPVQRKRKAG